jgi:hypothetical protein
MPKAFEDECMHCSHLIFLKLLVSYYTTHILDITKLSFEQRETAACRFSNVLPANQANVLIKRVSDIIVQISANSPRKNNANLCHPLCSFF